MMGWLPWVGCHVRPAMFVVSSKKIMVVVSAKAFFDMMSNFPFTERDQKCGRHDSLCHINRHNDKCIEIQAGYNRYKPIPACTTQM